MPSRSPIVPPRDAPPVRKTTPPFSPAHNALAPPIPDSIWLGNSAFIPVPITLQGGRPYIDAIVDGHPSKVLVDTATVTTLVDAALVEDRAQASFSLQIGDLRFPHVLAQRSAVRAYSATNLGAPADVLIGRDLLAHYPVRFDFPDRTLTIYRDSKSAAAAQPANVTTAALRIIDGRPAVQASLDGDSPLWFALATGAGFEMQLDSDVDRANRLARQASLPYQEPSATGQMSGTLVRARTVTVAGVAFHQPLVAIVGMRDPPASELSGALGSRLLSRLDVVVDESSSNVAFAAPPGALSAPLYASSGISLALHQSNIVIRSILPGSPADAQRLRAGDTIVSINGLAPATLDFARELLDASPGTRVTILFRRRGITRTATLTLRVLI